MTKPMKLFVRVKDDYPHHEILRGEIAVFLKDYGDGTVLIFFEEGPHKGDRVCLAKKYVKAI